MLGDQLGEERGQVTGTRVLPSASGPRIENSIHATGTMCGVPHNHIATYEVTIRPDGLVFGEGQGLVTTSAGDVATWKGSGIGRFTSDGGTEFRGAVYYETSSPKLAPLNGVAAIFEYSVDASGKTEGRVFEWK